MKVLVVSWTLPFPPIGGGKLRAYHLIRALSRQFDVTLVGFSYPGETAIPPPFPLRTVDVLWHPPARYRGDASGPEIDHPWLVSYFESDAMEAALRAVGAETFDAVVLLTSPMARFLSVLPPNVPTVIDFDNVFAWMARRDADAASGDTREAEKILAFERSAAARCTLCTACSAEEATAVRTLLGVDRVEIVPNGVDTTFFTPTDAEPRPGFLLFTGSMNYPPNVQAVRYFCRDILPRIKPDLPGATLHIVGANPTEEVAGLAADDVIVQGFVPDMRPYYREAEVVVVPLLRGGGTRLKILEAAAGGKAIVSTSIGAEGLRFAPGRDILLADTAQRFAEAVVTLSNDASRRRRLGEAARRTALGYDWQEIGHHFRRLVDRLTALAPR